MVALIAFPNRASQLGHPDISPSDPYLRALAVLLSTSYSASDFGFHLNAKSASFHAYHRPLTNSNMHTLVPSSIPIHSGWSFTQLGQRGDASVMAKEEWHPVSTFPTSVHVELIKLGKIPDPYIGLNEWDVQCELLLLLDSTP
jgi:hypothetical protein